MLVDLHVHTNLSSDSRVAAEQYLEAIAKNATPLGALCFTEHRLFPVDDEIDRTYAELSQQYGVHIFKGVEADTNLGHLLIFGITREFRRRFNLDSRLLRAEHVIEVVHGEGGIAIPAHPFRDSGYGMRLDDLLAKLGPALSAIEAVNGQNSADQNAEAIAMAEKLGLTPLGGSDAHFSTANWFLTCATELDREVGTVEELCVELRAGRARPYYFPRDDGATDQ
jgi:predicted metal-dependent phosphoesterase TrpH